MCANIFSYDFVLLVSKTRNDCKMGCLLVRQGGILSPQLFNIDGLSDILNKSSIGGPIVGKRINHMLYADDLCIVSLSSAGLQQLLSIDQYCAIHSITFNVKISICMFFRCSMNKICDITNGVLSGNTIDYVHKTKFQGGGAPMLSLLE